MPCWCTVSSITKGTRRSRASFGSLSHLPKMGRPRPSRTTQVRWPEKHNSPTLPALFPCWSMLLCFGDFLRSVSECYLWERMMILSVPPQRYPELRDVLFKYYWALQSLPGASPARLLEHHRGSSSDETHTMCSMVCLCVSQCYLHSTSVCAFPCAVLLLPVLGHSSPSGFRSTSFSLTVL